MRCIHIGYYYLLYYYYYYALAPKKKTFLKRNRTPRFKYSCDRTLKEKIYLRKN